jgi:hypothetical protein
MRVWMITSLTPERLDEFHSYSALNNLCVIGRCPSKASSLPSKAGVM